jgi:hypothetical protein
MANHSEFVSGLKATTLAKHGPPSPVAHGFGEQPIEVPPRIHPAASNAGWNHPGLVEYQSISPMNQVGEIPDLSMLKPTFTAVIVIDRGECHHQQSGGITRLNRRRRDERRVKIEIELVSAEPHRLLMLPATLDTHGRPGGFAFGPEAVLR